MTRPGSIVRSAGDQAALLALIISVWWGASLGFGGELVPSPSRTFAQVHNILLSDKFLIHFKVTMVTVAYSILISVALGVVGGLICGSSRLLTDTYEPILVALYTVPKVAFFPVILLLAGSGQKAQVVYGVIHGVVPIAMFTIAAVRSVRPVHLKTARLMGLSSVEIWYRIILPSTIPEIFSGIRIGVALSFIGTIFGEMFGSTQGLGFLLMNSLVGADLTKTMAIAVIMLTVALGMTVSLLAIDKKLHTRIS